MKELAIIIPTWNAHKTIARTMGSIIQQTIADKLHIYIVNDADGTDYRYIANDFGKYVKITLIEMEENGGSGVARQVGIDNSSEPFIMFIDTDDTFASPFALKSMLDYMKKPELVVVSGSFLEELQTGGYFHHHRDFLWMHGKIYRRSFLDKYDIRFNLTRANEDMGFNYKIKVLENPTEQIGYVNDVIYYWHYYENSIVRANNQEYAYTKSIEGTAVNLIDIYNFFKGTAFEQKANELIIEAFIGQYYTYIEMTTKHPEHKENILKWHKEFGKVVQEIDPTLFKQHEAKRFSEITGKRLRDISGILPSISYKQYKDLLWRKRK